MTKSGMNSKKVGRETDTFLQHWVFTIESTANWVFEFFNWVFVKFIMYNLFSYVFYATSTIQCSLVPLPIGTGCLKKYYM